MNHTMGTGAVIGFGSVKHERPSERRIYNAERRRARQQVRSTLNALLQRPEATDEERQKLMIMLSGHHLPNPVRRAEAARRREAALAAAATITPNHLGNYGWNRGN